ncbi:MAG: PilZ domain-containing protein [Deltaproteobacteria bacterium]|jgi:hypothetical protein|nr:PilZ domain-containing protein [Deltaproteobacteria bacterium]
MTNNDNKISIEEVYARILGIFSTLSENQMRNLLKSLEKWQKSKSVEKRKHHRQLTSIWAECSTNRYVYTDFIKNLSVGGLFIETRFPFFVGEELTSTFSLSDPENPIRITGKIVRVNSKGIGMQFDELLPDP